MTTEHTHPQKFRSRVVNLIVHFRFLSHPAGASPGDGGGDAVRQFRVLLGDSLVDGVLLLGVRWREQDLSCCGFHVGEHILLGWIR